MKKAFYKLMIHITKKRRDRELSKNGAYTDKYEYLRFDVKYYELRLRQVR